MTITSSGFARSSSGNRTEATALSKSTSAAESEGFFVAPYAPDGEFLGIGFRQRSDLSPRWLEAAAGFLHAHGSSFRASWGRELNDIETRLTSSNGVALGTFYLGGQIVSSHLFLTGGDVEGERQLTEMFLKSLLNVRLVQIVAKGPDPFGTVRTHAQRPLEVVVIWPPEGVSDERLAMTHELASHFAGAFFHAQVHGGLGASG